LRQTGDMTPPAYPALYASHGGIWIADDAGTRGIGRGEAISKAAETPVILLNAPLVGQRLGYPDLNGLDLLELFAFVHPAQFVVPTVKGLAEALNIAPPADESAAASALRLIAAALVKQMSATDWPEREGAWTSAQTLGRLRWTWGGVVGEALAKPKENERWLFAKLPEWEEKPPRPAPRTISVPPESALERLDDLTGEGAERRDGQRAYAEAATAAFEPRARRDEPNMLLAEAGTGIGKTLAYLSPASLWADKAGGTVWISTYTKALQRQLDGETRRLFPDAAERKAKVVIRKGRENYLCLLNLEDALQGGFSGRAAILAHLVARWASFSRDGDMVGGDMPGWLPTLFRRAGSTALTDRRGECVYAGCPHYRKCFIERAARASADADLVIANHALVMVNAARRVR
jgi:ATP-dependent DNA helicase DinG